MARIYQDFIGGKTDAALTDVATTLSSPELASMQAVTAPDTMMIALNPDQVGTAAEIVTVTAHTASATTATITRGSDGTTAIAHVSGIDWVHAVVESDVSSHAAKAWRSAAYTLAGSVGTPDVIEFDSEVYDISSAMASGVYTAPVDGIYNVSARISVTSPANTERFVLVCHVNGSEKMRGSDSTWLTGMSNLGLVLSGDLALTASQTVDIRVNQVNGTLRAIETGPSFAFFSIHKVAS